MHVEGEREREKGISSARSAAGLWLSGNAVADEGGLPTEDGGTLIVKVFQFLTRWRSGGIYPKTLAIALGVLQITYSSPRDGYRIYPPSVGDVDNLGKHLDKEKGQNDPRNRCILDILDRVGSLEGLRWDESMEQVARQALQIRSYFFDNSKLLEECMPQVLLVRGDYLQNETSPQQLFIG